MNTYGFHSIHGRAPTFATGLRVSRPDLQVWMVTGDGDGLSIGANHLIHALRRNIDIKILLFNNRIYGLTKGQYSPTSKIGKKTKSSPMGSIENPLNPIYTAIGAEATFVGRAIATESKKMQDIIMRAARHKGTAFIEILQNCNVFNDGTFDSFTARAVRDDRTIDLVHGEPLVFGKDKEKALVFSNESKDLNIEIVNRSEIDDGRLLIHDEKAEPNFLARLLAGMDEETCPIPLGVFRSIEKPLYGDLLTGQIEEARKTEGKGDLMDHIYKGDTWTVD
jgi:2-oxoglutarate ferredoxin oxidoreductase subunit beta